MSTYILSYDLKKNRNYEALYKVIRSFGSYAKIQESVWAINTDQSVVAVRDRIMKVLDNDDSVFVVKSGGEAAWHRVSNSEWLKEHL